MNLSEEGYTSMAGFYKCGSEPTGAMKDGKGIDHPWVSFCIQAYH
jgi:hypothetical protein